MGSMELLRDGGLRIEVEGVVINARWFNANGKKVAKVTLVGNRGGPMGEGVRCDPYGIFEVDAEYSVWLALRERLDQPPIKARFTADLKPVTDERYVLHLLEFVAEV